jgi:hypothetical protein
VKCALSSRKKNINKRINMDIIKNGKNKSFTTTRGSLNWRAKYQYNVNMLNTKRKKKRKTGK